MTQKVIIYTMVVIAGAICTRLLPKKWSKVLLVIYAIGIFYFTFLSREPRPTAIISLKLFKATRRVITVDLGLSTFLKNLFTTGEVGNITVEWNKLGEEPLLNILLFVPLGYLLPSVFRFFQKHPWRTIVSGLLTSLSVETIQLLTLRGWFDIDDLINNTLGCLIGVVVWVTLLRKKYNHKEYKEQTHRG
jgi:glycopeptide antibiotics resistance protein